MHRRILIRARTLRFIAFCFFVGIAWPQGVITTIAGTDFVFPRRPLAATDAPVSVVFAIALDSKGNLYLADEFDHVVCKVDQSGTLTVVAGNGVDGFSGDGGPAVTASLQFPAGLAVDAAGNLFIADQLRHRIRKVTPAGIITTYAGNGIGTYSGDGGSAVSASLNNPVGLFLDPAGNLYVADSGNHRIRKITPSGIISTVAGNGTQGFGGDGQSAGSASFNLPTGVALDSSGNIYVADSSNNRIRKINTSGIITTVAGNGNFDFSGDGGPAINAALALPHSVTFDAAGNMYIADDSNNRIRKVTPGGIISTLAGGDAGFSGDGGLATSALLHAPKTLVFDALGNLLIADNLNGRVRKITPGGFISTVAGGGNRNVADNGPATSAFLNPQGYVVMDSTGNLLFSDSGNNRIRKITPNGIISTVAGNGNFGSSGDGGPAINASLAIPQGIALDTAGNLYIADFANSKIRKVTTGGTISTIAGNGHPGFSGDGGQATSASLLFPQGVAVDPAGNVFIADTYNNRIRKVTVGGIINTVVGNDFFGYSGDGSGSDASIYGPSGLTVDSSGNLLIADSFDNLVLKLTPAGFIFCVAGNGGAGFSSDGGAAISTSLNNPEAVSVDSSGNMFIADTMNNRIRKVTPVGIISTVAGNGIAAFSGDGGLAVNASLNSPGGVLVDSAGNLFIGDSGNNRIRAILKAPPSVQVSPQQLRFTASSGGALPPVQILTLAASIPGVLFSTQSSTNWLRVSPQSGASPRLIEVTADPTNLPPGTTSGSITISSPNATPPSATVQVSFTVGPGQPPALSTDKSNLSFAFPQSGVAHSDTLTIFNTGGGTLAFTVVAQTATGGNWLSLSPASGQATPPNSASLTVTANPAGLEPGTYSGSLTISAGGTTQLIPVTMTISQLNQAILLTQTGLSFLGVANGGVVLPQRFGVLNTGNGVVNWKVSTSVLSGGNWLTADTVTGSSDASVSTVPTVGVNVNAAPLAPGKYYGLVRVDAPGAANTPQVVTVFLQVLPAGSNAGAAVQPAELLFTTFSSGSSPSSQEVLLSDISGLPTSFRAAVSSDNSKIGMSVLPFDSPLDPQNPNHVIVQPFLPFGLAPGAYTGAITFQFSDGRVGVVKTKIIVAAGAGPGQSQLPGFANTPEASCQPTQLLTALNTLGQSFAISAGWPVALAVDVKDDCGNQLDAPGTVTVSFSNGDPPLSLRSVKSGRWEGTWTTGSSAGAQVDLTIQAADAQGKLFGKSQVSGALQSPTDPPLFTQPGVVSAAAPKSFVPTAPGSIVSIYGNLLAQNNAPATTIPLSNSLAGTSMIMAGEIVPLYYVSQGQVNALVPYDINVNTPQQIVIQRGLTYSQPVSVSVASAQPAVFLDSSVSATQGFIFAVRGQGASQIQFEAKPGSPATAGDVIVLFCAGLGPVNPAVPSGTAPTGISSTTNPVKLTIGSQPATVLFSGLTPGFVGLYQINAAVPQQAPTGDTVPVTITVAGQTSPPSTMAIR